MKCPKCGADVTGTEKFCYACGNEISQPTTEPTPQVVDNIQTEPVNQTVESVAPVSEAAAPQVAADAVNTPVTEPVAQPVAQPVAEPVVEQPAQPTATLEVSVESSQPVEAAAPVSEPTVDQPAQMASEPTQPEVAPASMEAPVTGEVPASAEPPKKKSSKGLLIVVIVILIAALGVGGYFVYNQYFVEDANEDAGNVEIGGGDAETDNGNDSTIDNSSLVCSRLSGEFNSVVNLDYIDGELSSYSMSYNASTYGMEEEDVNSIIEQYNTLVAQVTAFENEVGFNLYVSDSVDQETGAHTMNVNYTIDLGVATNTEMLALIGEADMTIQEQTTALEAQDYTCS